MKRLLLSAMMLALPLSAAAEKLSGLEIGPWGGEHARATVTQNEVKIELDCAEAAIPERPKLDREGKFHAVGSYTFFHGGPSREGEQPDKHPADFQGQVKKDSLTLTISVQKGTENLRFRFGPLQRGSSGVLYTCL